MSNRRRIYIVYHSLTRSVWKHLFFMKKEQALGAVKDFYRHVKTWNNRSKDSIQSQGGGTFTVMSLDEFTKRSDIPLSETTKFIKNLKENREEP